MASGADVARQGALRETAFKGLVGPRLDRAYGLAWHLLGNAPDAEDACQEALLAAWSAWPRLRDPSRFEAWFERILINVCSEHLRRRARRPTIVLPDEPGIPDLDALAVRVERDAMAGALASLTPEQRIAVVLRFWADLSTDAIAERLGVPPGTVRSRLHYALDTLRRQMAAEGRLR